VAKSHTFLFLSRHCSIGKIQNIKRLEEYCFWHQYCFFNVRFHFDARKTKAEAMIESRAMGVGF
jgi:hypothetical protein